MNAWQYIAAQVVPAQVGVGEETQRPSSQRSNMILAFSLGHYSDHLSVSDTLNT